MCQRSEDRNLTALASLDSTHELADEDVGLLLRDVEATIDRQAAQVALLLIAGCPPSEIKKRLALTGPQYLEAVGWLRATMR
jgi:hypothetical protein